MLETNDIEGLEKLAELRRTGVLNEQEFEAAKQRILGTETGAAAPALFQDDGDLSSKWQRRFQFFDENGAPGQGSYRMAYRSLSFPEKTLIGFNFWGFFFGPIYFLYLGLFRRAIGILALSAAIVFVAILFGAPDRLLRVLGMGISVSFAATANYAYYLKARHGDGWNPVSVLFPAGTRPGAILGAIAAALVLLGIAGLLLNGRGIADEVGISETADAGARGPLTAIFSCHSGGAEFPASACIIGHQSTGGVGGALRIENGDDVHAYSESEILDDLAASRADITLHEPFALFVQAGGDSDLVLRLEILEGGQVVYQDEASKFGVIFIDSGHLPRDPIAGAEAPRTTEQKIKELQEAVAAQTRALEEQGPR